MAGRDSSPTVSAGRPPTPQPARSSLWGPLRHTAFRNFWAAGLLSMLGTWMQGTGGAWLMAGLSHSPSLVAMMQTAQMTPGLLIALPAGALVDRCDRRLFLLGAASWQILAIVSLAVLAGLRLLAPWQLLLFTFLLSVGSVAQGPAAAAALRAFVPLEELPNAVALNSLSLNFSRAVGPALAGVVIGLAGVSTVFWLNAASLLALVVVLILWRPPARPVRTEQGLIRAMLDGILHAASAGPFRQLLVRGGAIFFFGGVNVALAPILARSRLALNVQSFGVLMGAMGAGAVVMALFGVAALRARFTAEALMLGAGFALAGLIFLIGQLTNYPLMVLALALFGAAWMLALFSYQLAAQLTLPNHLLGRGLSLTTMVFMGTMAVGGLFWGQVAQRLSISAAYSLSAFGLMAVSAIDLVRRRRRA
jgi:MFS family permease